MVDRTGSRRLVERSTKGLTLKDQSWSQSLESRSTFIATCSPDIVNRCHSDGARENGETSSCFSVDFCKPKKETFPLWRRQSRLGQRHFLKRRASHSRHVPALPLFQFRKARRKFRRARGLKMLGFLRGHNVNSTRPPTGIIESPDFIQLTVLVGTKADRSRIGHKGDLATYSVARNASQREQGRNDPYAHSWDFALTSVPLFPSCSSGNTRVGQPKSRMRPGKVALDVILAMESCEKRQSKSN